MALERAVDGSHSQVMVQGPLWSFIIALSEASSTGQLSPGWTQGNDGGYDYFKPNGVELTSQIMPALVKGGDSEFRVFSRAVILNIGCTWESPGSFDSTSGPSLGNSDSISLGCGLSMRAILKLPK